MEQCCVQGCSNRAPLRCEGCNVAWCRQCAETTSSGGKTGHFCLICGQKLDEQTGHKDEIQRIREVVADAGGTAYVLHQGTKLQGSAGIPDMCAFYPDPETGQRRFTWIEVKVGRDTPSDEQERFAERCEEAGVEHVTGRAGDVAEHLGLTDARRRA